MSRPRIVCLSPAQVVAPVYRRISAQMEDHELTFVEPRSREVMEEQLGAADFVLGDWTHEMRLDSTALEGADRCRLVVQPTAGFDAIDVGRAHDLGLPVANCPGANAASVAEWTVMTMLAALKNLVINHERTRRGEWWMSTALDEGVFDLGGRTVGILGFGRIGQGVARRLQGFDVSRILYFDPFVDVAEVGPGMPVERVDDVDEICRRSDVLSVHLPLMPETHHVVGRHQLELLGPQGVLVNASRGLVVDETALHDALAGKTLKAAALDVFAEEPLPASHRWQDLGNVVLSPHISGGTVEARDRMVSQALAKIDAAMLGELPDSVVNGVRSLR